MDYEIHTTFSCVAVSSIAAGMVFMGDFPMLISHCSFGEKVLFAGVIGARCNRRSLSGRRCVDSFFAAFQLDVPSVVIRLS